MENITSNFSVACGTYEQLEYWPNNFDDFGVSHTWMSADGLSPEPEVQRLCPRSEDLLSDEDVSEDSGTAFLVFSELVVFK